VIDAINQALPELRKRVSKQSVVGKGVAAVNSEADEIEVQITSNEEPPQPLRIQPQRDPPPPGSTPPSSTVFPENRASNDFSKRQEAELIPTQNTATHDVAHNTEKGNERVRNVVYQPLAGGPLVARATAIAISNMAAAHEDIEIMRRVKREAQNL
jgi:hypothetical protein